MKVLAVRNAQLDDENQDGMTPMALAAYASQMEVVQGMAARNAKYNADK